MNAFVQKFIGALTLFFSLLTLGSLLGRFYWLLDILSHYHLQYTVGLTLCLLGLIYVRSASRALLLPVIALLINLYLVVPFFLPLSTPTTHAATANAPLRVMAMNISTSNAGYEKVVALISERQPDVIFLSEVREDLLAVLRTELGEAYPYLHAEPSRMTLGLAFLSRQPFQRVETVSLDGRSRRYLRAEIDWQGKSVVLLGIHPLPPMRKAWSLSRDQEIAQMGEIANATAHPLILLGDLNASPWSTPMRRLHATTPLRYALQGHGIWPTWHLAGVLLGAPLDYILVSPAWRVEDYLEGGDIGSDHVPVQADLRLATPRQ